MSLDGEPSQLIRVTKSIEVHLDHAVINGRLLVRHPTHEIGTTDDDLRRFWFRMTPAGETTRQQASNVLDAY